MLNIHHCVLLTCKYDETPGDYNFLLTVTAAEIKLKLKFTSEDQCLHYVSRHSYDSP